LFLFSSFVSAVLLKIQKYFMEEIYPSSKSASSAVYTPQEIAGRSGLSRRRIYDWLSWGWLRGSRRGGRWIVASEDWEFFIRVCRGARGRLMPSLRDWEPIWKERTCPHD
jgi:hypothetical protein